MPSKFILRASLGLALCGLATAKPAYAYMIDFDSEGLTGPTLASQTSAKTIAVATPIGNVTFSGGAILTNEAFLPADTSSVYYTSFFLSGGLDPITVTFPTNILNFFLNVYNGETYTESFTVSDNVGNTNTVSLPNNSSGGLAQIAFAAAGSVVTISTPDATGFDFSIDTIGFDQTPSGTVTIPTGTNTIPEPMDLAVFTAGLSCLALIRRRRT